MGSQKAPTFTIPFDTTVSGHLYIVSSILDQRYEIQDNDTGNTVVTGDASPGTQYNSSPVSFAAKKGIVYKILLRHKNKANGQWEANYYASNSTYDGKAGGLNYIAVASDDGGQAFDYNDAIFILHWAQYK